ncbi:carbohydrate kinase family protein [Haloferacaceae archaeon DSL9]
MRTLCAGHVNWDVTLRVDHLPVADGEAAVESRSQAGGGSAANTAVALASLGVDSALFGSVGADECGALVRRELEAAGVDCSRLVTVAGDTTVKYLVVDGDGEVMMLSDPGENEAFEATDLPESAFDIDHLHLTSQPPSVAAALAARAREAGARVSFDPGRRFGDRDYCETLRLADILFLNLLEANELIDSGAYESVSDRTIVVITRGSNGAEVTLPDDVITHDGFEVASIDTTGAGDAFAAGFIAASRRSDYAETLAVANACGAIASEQMGARTHLSWEAIDRVLVGD